MKRAFIFDLNIVRFAATIKNERDEDDLSSNILLKKVINNCNAICYPCGYDGEYLRIWSNLSSQKASIDNSLFYLWKQAGFVSDKLNPVDVSGLLNLEESGSYHNDDEDLVKLAAHLSNGAVIASTDDRLRITLDGLEIPIKYGFVIKRPEDAIQIIKYDV
jgi:hypothetical protein